MMRIGVLGGGAWGTALAQVAAHGGREVLLWAREPEVVEAINRDHLNPLFLNDIPLSTSIVATTDPGRMRDLDALLVVVPAQHVAAILSATPVGTTPLVLCAKGSRRVRGVWWGRSRAPRTRPRRSPCCPARPSRTRSRGACRPR